VRGKKKGPPQSLRAFEKNRIKLPRFPTPLKQFPFQKKDEPKSSGTSVKPKEIGRPITQLFPVRKKFHNTATLEKPEGVDWGWEKNPTGVHNGVFLQWENHPPKGAGLGLKREEIEKKKNKKKKPQKLLVLTKRGVKGGIKWGK